MLLYVLNVRTLHILREGIFLEIFWCLLVCSFLVIMKFKGSIHGEM